MRPRIRRRATRRGVRFDGQRRARSAAEKPDDPTAPKQHRSTDGDSDLDTDGSASSQSDAGLLTIAARLKMAPRGGAASVPGLFTSLPPIRDLLKTDSSNAQDFVLQDCLPLLAGTNAAGGPPGGVNEHGVPRLDRESHVEFLHDTLGALPAGFVMADASRPWMLYWALTALHLLGEDVSQYRERYVETLTMSISSIELLASVMSDKTASMSPYACLFLLVRRAEPRIESFRRSPPCRMPLGVLAAATARCRTPPPHTRPS